jgi:hypothetical protein
MEDPRKLWGTKGNWEESMGRWAACSVKTAIKRTLTTTANYHGGELERVDNQGVVDDG